MKELLILTMLFTYNLSCQSYKTVSIVPCETFEDLNLLQEMQCGVITVPEDHNNPNGKVLQISYVVIPAKDASSKEFPMIYLSGGPGAASLVAQQIKRWSNSSIRKNRDIILFDQRGIGYSSGLPNLHQEFYTIFSKDIHEDEEQMLIDEMMANYKEICADQNIELQHYNSFQNAMDVGILMDHLVYAKYNLYGVSYGTRLARIIQELYPESLNSVMLNSPNPIVGDLLVDRLMSYSLALGRILDYCTNDSVCHTSYPNLEERYLTAINTLKQNPLELDIDGKAFFLNAQDGLYFLRRKLYGSDSRTAIPLLIQEIENGGGPMIKNLIQNEFKSNYNFLMWLTVERSEMYNPENTTDVINEVYESLPLLPAKLGLFSSCYLAMSKLHDSTISEKQKTFKTSKVPTMITVNQYDPVTPPENGQILLQGLTNGQLFILDEGGHGGGNIECRYEVMSDFMNNPSLALDTSCLNLYHK